MTHDLLAVHGGRPLRKEFLPFHRPFIGEEEIAEVTAALRSGWITTGPRTKAFEKKFAEYIGCPHAIGLNSCTAGLHLALEAAGISAGDEVITSPLTFASTANVIVHQKATPVFVDVEPGTLNINADLIEEKITPRTRAIIPVHLAGHPCDMNKITAIAAQHGLVVVEDAAHALEAEFQGKKVGSFSTFTAFSFYATKNITTGEGGMLTVLDDNLADKARILSLHGISRDAWKRYSDEGYRHWDILYAGYKYNMFDLQAAVGMHQLDRVEHFLGLRKRYVELYNHAFAQYPEITRLEVKPGIKHCHHLYIVLFDIERITGTRDEIMNAIQAENIGIGIHFRAVHLHPFYRKTFGFVPGKLPVAESASERLLSLPLYPAMSEVDVRDVIAVVEKVIRAFRRSA